MVLATSSTTYCPMLVTSSTTYDTGARHVIHHIIVYRCPPHHPPHVLVPMLATSSTTMHECPGARHVTHRWRYRCSPRRPPHSLRCLPRQLPHSVPVLAATSSTGWCTGVRKSPRHPPHVYRCSRIHHFGCQPVTISTRLQMNTRGTRGLPMPVSLRMLEQSCWWWLC